VTLSDIIRDALQRFVAEHEQAAVQQDRSDEGRRLNTPEDIERKD
jgi:hypothetical protein